MNCGASVYLVGKSITINFRAVPLVSRTVRVGNWRMRLFYIRKCSAESFRAVPLISNCLDRELEDKVVF